MNLQRSVLVVLSLFITGIIFYISSAVQAASTSQFGTQIDTNSVAKIPSSEQLSQINSSWVRFVWRSDKGIPVLPPGQKILLIVNNESAPPAPIFSTDIQVWRSYTDNTYIPQLTHILNTSPNIAAIEVWNEEDLCDRGGTFCPGIPEQAYSYLLKKAAATIKAKNPNMTVVMGGLASGDTGYVTRVKNADPAVFNQVDVVGIHPYDKSPDGWCIAN